MSTARTAGLIGALPNAPLHSVGPVSRAFLARGCHSAQAAAIALWQLPYGRNGDASSEVCVLVERRGTCSTKHALLKRLLDEQEIEGYELRVGIYQMTEANTPGVGAVLHRHGLVSIPEAHCYIVVDEGILDVTRVLPAEAEPIERFLAEETITPEQTREFKREFHRLYLASEVAKGTFGAQTLDEVWAIREECIAALAE